MKGRVLKVVTWRLISICITMVFLYVATGDLKAATGITLALHTILTASHYFFESTWQRIHKDENR